MVPGRPLLYLSLPGVAFILGVFWLRRRNKVRCGDTGKPKKTGNDSPEVIETKIEATIMKKQQSNSVNVNRSAKADDNSNCNNLGKSAPIKIVQNGRNSPVYMSDKQIDTEILKFKIQDAEDKTLRAIDEDFECLSSPVDLPESVDRRQRSFNSVRSGSTEKPVIIRATTAAKISPENSFLESKYTQETGPIEQNNNNKSKPVENLGDDDEPPHVNNNEEIDDSKRKTDVASPPLSLCSVQSADSGKGSSLPRSEPIRSRTSYEFFLPTSLIGRFYGRKHKYVNYIKAKTSATISLRKHPATDKIQVCVLEGTDNEISSALALIRNKLPVKRYPNLTMQRIHFATPQTIVPLTTEHSVGLKLNLIEGINNDVLVSAVVSGGHVFVQQPLHPSHPSLPILQKCLYDSYTNCETPLLPEIAENAICVALVDGQWFRVQVAQKDATDENKCLVKFLDFGGYMTINTSDLRQIRSDFMAMPFQSTECVLSNIEPIDSSWSPKSAEVLYNLTRGIILQAQVAGYNSDNMPEILLYASIGPNNVIFINKEIVARNLAKWVETQN